MIPEAKITALREALERKGTVTFKNGSVVERELKRVTDVNGKGDMEIRQVARLVVKRPAGGSMRFADSDAEIRRAYEMALNGPRPKQQPTERDFGEVPF